LCTSTGGDDGITDALPASLSDGKTIVCVREIKSECDDTGDSVVFRSGTVKTIWKDKNKSFNVSKANEQTATVRQII
jgi:hypothetical protein